MKQDRKARPPARARAEGYAKPQRGGGRPPRARSEAGPPRFRAEEKRAPRFRAGEGAAPSQDYRDPYRPARRPARPDRDEFGPREERGGRAFTVTLDPDVARVFRGDASVNKALRLVMQLMQVVQGPRASPRGEGVSRPARREGYRGSPEARGFTRKPRFGEEDDNEHGNERDIEE